MASFDNLVARKGSPTHSLRSGSTNASTSNVSETRDIARQSEQQARLDHRKAIQARKVAFLFVVLLLLVGGLSYAIYKVVSNKSDENETAKLKLDQNGMSSSKVPEQTLNRAKQTLNDTSGTPTAVVNPTSAEQISSTPSTHPKPQSSQMFSQDHESSDFDTVASTHHYLDKSTEGTTPSTETMHDKQSLHSWQLKSSNIEDSTVLNIASSYSFRTYVSQSTIGMGKTPPLLALSTSASTWEHPKTSTIKMETSMMSIKLDVATTTTKISLVGKDTLAKSNLQSTRTEIHSFSKTTKSPSISVSTKISSPNQSVLRASETLLSNKTILNDSVTNSINSVTINTTTKQDISSSKYIEMSKSIVPTTVMFNPSVNVDITNASSVGLIDQPSYANVTSSINSAQISINIMPSKASSSPIPSSSVWIEPYYLTWGNWSACSLNCGGGYKTSARKCSQENGCDNLGSNVNISACNMHKCNETTFGLSLNVTEFQWTEDYKNTSSPQYKKLVDRVMEQLRAQYGPNITAEVDNVSQGSVIVSFIITFPGTKTIQDFINAIEDGKLGNLSISVVQIINNMVPIELRYVTIENTTTNSTVLRWNGLHENETNGILLGYKIIIDPGNITLKIENPEETIYNITNLQPETIYTIQLLGYNINGDGIRRNVTFKTKELPPHYLPWGEWSNCSRNCGGGITTRTRNCSKEGLCGHLGLSQQPEHCNVVKCNETSYSVKTNITDVEWTPDLYNTSSQAYQDLLAKFIAELQKKYPNATISLGSITKGSIIFNFQISFNNDDSTSGETLKNDLEKTGLGNHSVAVNDIENNNLPKSPPVSINVALITHHSAIIRWLPISEDDSNGAIMGYIIVFFSPILNKTTEYNMSAKASDTEFLHELTMLAPNTSYHFHMYGYNINGKGVLSDTIKFTTKVQIPMISSTNVSQITTRHAVLYWSKIPDNNMTHGIIMGYKINLFKHDEMYHMEVSAKNGSVTLSNLSPNTTYNVTVLGFNGYGDGVVSDTFTFRTMVQIPMINSANVSEITTHHVVLYWSRIPDNNITYGNILGYKILLFKHNEKKPITVSANETNVILSNLSPNTTYNATVLGFNEYGDGVVSDIITFKTIEEETNKPFITPSSPLTTPSSHQLAPSRHQPATTVTPNISTASSFTETLLLSSQETKLSVTRSNTTSLKDAQTTTMDSLTRSSSFASSMTQLHHNLPYSFSLVLSSQSVDSSNVHSSTTSSSVAHTTNAPTTNPTYSSLSVTVSPSISIQLTNNTTITSQPTTKAQQPDKNYIVGEIRLTDEQWNSDLLDPQSNKFKEIQTEMEEALTLLLNESNIEFERVEVYEFSAGSVVVSFYVILAANYKPENISYALKASEEKGLNNKPFAVDMDKFRLEEVKPTMATASPNEASKGKQKTNDDDDSALIIAIILCVVLAIGVMVVVIFIGKKRNWFDRSRRKVVPDDDDEDDLYPGPQTERMRLAKSARAPRKARGERINGGHSTTEC